MEHFIRADSAQNHTIADLFISGQLAAAEETAMDEIECMRSAYGAMVNPGCASSGSWKAYCGPRTSPAKIPSASQSIPRMLGKRGPERRYRALHKNWHQKVIPPSPGNPWGLTAAGVVVNLIIEPHGFEYYASRMGVHPSVVVNMFVRILRDYSGSRVADRQKANVEWEGEQRRYVRLAQRIHQISRTSKQRQRWRRASKRQYSKKSKK